MFGEFQKKIEGKTVRQYFYFPNVGNARKKQKI